MKFPRPIDAALSQSGVMPEFGRFVVNGLFATMVHFGFLTLGIEIFHLSMAGVANFFAAVIGVAVSFLGNRYYVFNNQSETLVQQGARFAALYLVIAVFHAAFLMVWTDWLGHDYRTGFLIATAIQVIFTFLGARRLVFAK